MKNLFLKYFKYDLKNFSKYIFLLIIVKIVTSVFLVTFDRVQVHLSGFFVVLFGNLVTFATLIFLFSFYILIFICIAEIFRDYFTKEKSINNHIALSGAQKIISKIAVFFVMVTIYFIIEISINLLITTIVKGNPIISTNYIVDIFTSGNIMVLLDIVLLGITAVSVCYLCISVSISLLGRKIGKFAWGIFLVLSAVIGYAIRISIINQDVILMSFKDPSVNAYNLTEISIWFGICAITSIISIAIAGKLMDDKVDFQ